MRPFLAVFITSFVINELEIYGKFGSHYVKVESSILQMEDVFACSSCNVEFINSAIKIRA